MLDGVKLRLHHCQPAAAAGRLVDLIAHRFDGTHTDAHRWHVMTDLGAEMLSRNDRQQQRLIARHQIGITTECRREASHGCLHLFGIGPVQQQQAAGLQRDVRDLFEMRGIGRRGRRAGLLCHPGTISGSGRPAGRRVHEYARRRRPDAVSRRGRGRRCIRRSGRRYASEASRMLLSADRSGRWRGSLR